MRSLETAITPANFDTMGSSYMNEDNLTLRIFTLLFVNAFLVGSAVAIHHQGIWFSDVLEDESWPVVGLLYLMAGTFVQMIAFMLYKIFFFC